MLDERSLRREVAAASREDRDRIRAVRIRAVRIDHGLNLRGRRPRIGGRRSGSRIMRDAACGVATSDDQDQLRDAHAIAYSGTSNPRPICSSAALESKSDSDVIPIPADSHDTSSPARHFDGDIESRSPPRSAAPTVNAGVSVA